MVKTVQQIQAIKSGAERKLLAIPGVTGVAVGPKRVGGKKTEEVSIVVYVRRKRPMAEIPEQERVSPEIDGVKTDVVEREFELKHLLVPVEELRPRADTGTYDPLRGGISIGPCRSVFISGDDVACHGVPGPGSYVFVGTLGAFVTDNETGAMMMLSNFHVMALDNAWSVGDSIVQPSLVDDGSCLTGEVGQLQRASLGGKVDCAVASHTARGWSCEIIDIGEIKGQRTATLGLPVRKRGRTTGLTHGTVDSIDLTVPISYCNGLGDVTFTGQISIEVDEAQSTEFGLGGDSGSVVVDPFGQAVGLYFGGTIDGKAGVANPIGAVLSALNVSLCSTGTLKFLDDPVKIKMYDDTSPFFDPVQTKAKFADDPKLKFADDPAPLAGGPAGTQRFLNAPAKVKFLDDTNPFQDPVKTVVYDKSPWLDTNPAADIGGMPVPDYPVRSIPRAGQTIPGTPFVMATPHHAYTFIGGGQPQAMLAELEAWLKQRAQVLTRAYEQYQQGTMPAAALAQFQREVAEYQTALAQYRELEGAQGAAGGAQ